MFKWIFCILITQKCSLVNKMNTWYISCHFHRQMDTVCYSKKKRDYILLICTRNQFFCQFHSLYIMILARVIDYYCYFHMIYVLIQDLFLTSSHYIMTNGIFLNIEDYIFFTSVSIVCSRKLMNLGT